MKIATLEDFDEILSMSMKFLEKTDYTEYSDEETISQLIRNILTGEQNQMIILLKPGMGFIAGVSSPFVFGPHFIASELAWWVNEDARSSGVGAELLDAFEYWAKNVAKCTMVTMTTLNNDEIGKFYEKKGYGLYEKAYMKKL